MPTSKPYHEYLIESLKDPREALEYLLAAIEDGNPEVIKLAVKNIREAMQLWDGK